MARPLRSLVWICLRIRKALRQVTTLEGRREAHVQQKKLSEETFGRLMDKLQEKLPNARLELHEATLEDLDVEAVLGFAEQVLLDAPRLWIEFDLDQRQQFQRIVFPEGLVFDGAGFRTAVTNPVFSYLQGIELQNEGVVALGPRLSNPLIVELTAFESLRTAVD